MSISTELSDKIASRIDRGISSETALAPNGAMDFRNVEQIMNFAKVMAVAGAAIPKHLRDTPGACLAVAIQACEWKMSPFAVANKSYVVNDRMAFEAQLINAVILMRAPIQGRFKITYRGEGDSRQCRVAAKLNDGSGEEVEYESPRFDKIPVKNSPLWKADPDQQLFYYSSRAMCRRHFPDVILGVYAVDEVQDNPPIEREARGRDVSGGARVPELPSGVPASAVAETPPEPVSVPEKKPKGKAKPGNEPADSAGDHECAGEPPRFPGEPDARRRAQAAPPSARDEFERKCALNGVDIVTAHRAILDMDLTNATTPGEVDPTEWATCLARFSDILTTVKEGQS